MPFSTTNPLTWSSSASRAQMIDEVGEGGVADPLLLPVQHPLVAVAAGVVVSPPAIPEPVSGSVRPNAPISSIRAIAGSQRSLLLVRAAQVDRAHRQAAVHAHEGLHRRVDPGHLHRDHAVEQAPRPGQPWPSYCRPAMPERREPGHQVVRELRPGPVAVDHRLDLLVMNSRTRSSSSRSSSSSSSSKPQEVRVRACRRRCQSSRHGVIRALAGCVEEPLDHRGELVASVRMPRCPPW